MAKETLQKYLNRMLKSKGTTVTSEKKKASKYTSISAAKKAGSLYYTNKKGKVMAAVFGSDLKDIKANLKTEDFYRLRIGISHPGQSHLVTNYVLKQPSVADKNIILDSIDRGIDEVVDLLSGNISHATKRLNSVK